MNFNRRLCAALACAVFVLSGCAADKGSDKADNSEENVSSDISAVMSADSDTAESRNGQENDAQQGDELQSVNSQAEEKKTDYTPQLETIQSETDKLLTALRDGDVNSLADLLAPDTKWGRFFNSHRNSEGLSNILRVDFGDMVWTYSQLDTQTDIQWLETAAMQHGDYTQTYVTAGVKEMLYFSEYFLLNFGDGSVLTDSYAPDDEAQSQMLLEKTVKKLPLLKNHWSIPCTIPNKDGRVYFNLDDDFLMDYTRLMEMKDFTEEEIVTGYIKLMSEDRGKVMDDKANTGKDNDLRVKLLGLLKDREFEEAWQLLKPDADKEFYGDVPEYDRLTPMQQELVNEFVRDKVSVVVSDYSTEVYDGSSRRHIFCQISYDAFAQNDEEDIADWLAENGIKQSDGGVYFDITSKDMLPEVLNFYFEAVERAGETEGQGNGQ